MPTMCYVVYRLLNTLYRVSIGFQSSILKSFDRVSIGFRVSIWLVSAYLPIGFRFGKCLLTNFRGDRVSFSAGRSWSQVVNSEAGHDPIAKVSCSRDRFLDP